MFKILEKFVVSPKKTAIGVTVGAPNLLRAHGPVWAQMGPWAHGYRWVVWGVAGHHATKWRDRQAYHATLLTSMNVGARVVWNRLSTMVQIWIVQNAYLAQVTNNKMPWCLQTHITSTPVFIMSTPYQDQTFRP